MKFENTGIEKKKAELKRLDELMLAHGLVREEQWDYERVSYDRKFQLKEGVFYLRVFGYAAEGDVGANKAVIQLMTPLLGKYYHPHGVEYGEGENFPKTLVSQCDTILSELVSELNKFSN